MLVSKILGSWRYDTRGNGSWPQGCYDTVCEDSTKLQYQNWIYRMLASIISFRSDTVLTSYWGFGYLISSPHCTEAKIYLRLFKENFQMLVVITVWPNVVQMASILHHLVFLWHSSNMILSAFRLFLYLSTEKKNCFYHNIFLQISKSLFSWIIKKIRKNSKQTNIKKNKQNSEVKHTSHDTP